MNKIKEFFFKNTDQKQTLAKNTSWLFLGEMGSRLLKMVLIFYAARVIGVTGWGEFSYAMSLASICCFFSDAGLSSLVTREYSKGTSPTSYVTNAFFLKIVFVLFSFLVLLIASPLFAHGKGILLVIFIGLFILIDSLKDFSLSIFRAQQRMEIDAFMKVLTTLLITGIGFAVLLIHPTAFSLTIAYVTGSTLATLGILPSFIPYAKNFKLLDKKILKEIFWDNLFLGILIFTNALMLNEDTVIVGLLKGNYSAGLYAAAQKIIQTIYIIPAIITTSLLPVMSSHTHNHERFHYLYEKIVLFMFLIAIPIAIGGSLLSKQIITLFYGSAYAAAAPAMSILFFCVLSIFPSLFIIDSALSLNRHKELIVINVAANIFNVAANYILIKEFGIVGAAVASLVTLSLITLWMLTYFKRVTIKPWYGTLFKIALSTFGMIISIVILKTLHVPVIFTAIISGLVYSGLLILLQEKITKEYLVKTLMSLG